VSGREALRTFERDGWEHVRTKGDHMIMTKRGEGANLSIPDHRELDRGTLRRLITLAGLTVDDLIGPLKR
jgi:predicted RNA binding protein YcfA (HicA-like mRNA interferase family)